MSKYQLKLIRLIFSDIKWVSKMIFTNNLLNIIYSEENKYYTTKQNHSSNRKQCEMNSFHFLLFPMTVIIAYQSSCDTRAHIHTTTRSISCWNYCYCNKLFNCYINNCHTLLKQFLNVLSTFYRRFVVFPLHAVQKFVPESRISQMPSSVRTLHEFLTNLVTFP